MSTLHCAICKKVCDPRPSNPYAPFCSARCRQIDLGKWLDGAYRVPVEDSNDELDDPSAEGKSGGGDDDA